MLNPLTQFICDTCRQVISNPEDGWIEWESRIDDKTNKITSRNFRICHHEMPCQKLARHPHCSDLPLKEFVGEMASVQIANLLDVGVYHQRDYAGPEPTDMREFTELMRRLTIPYYEEARQWWNEAMTDGYFGDANEIYIYMPVNLRRMIEHYNEQ